MVHKVIQSVMFKHLKVKLRISMIFLKGRSLLVKMFIRKKEKVETKLCAPIGLKTKIFPSG